MVNVYIPRLFLNCTMVFTMVQNSLWFSLGFSLWFKFHYGFNCTMVSLWFHRVFTIDLVCLYYSLTRGSLWVSYSFTMVYIVSPMVSQGSRKPCKPRSRASGDMMGACATAKKLLIFLRFPLVLRPT